MGKILRKLSIILLLLLPVSCAGVKHQQKKEVDTRPVTIFFTNSTQGAFEPGGCGCRRMGGLGRRSVILTGMRQKHPGVVVIDTGNLLSPSTSRTRQEKQTEAHYLLYALKHMKTDVLNVGAYDCGAGISFLKTIQKELPFDLLSANIKSLGTEDLVFRPYTIKKISNVKLGIFGLSGYGNPLSLKSEGVYIDNPLQSARETVEKLKSRGCHPIILLSQLSHAENLRIARMVPGIDFVLGSSSITSTDDPVSEGSTSLICSKALGKTAGILEISSKNTSSSFFDIKIRQDIENKIAVLNKQQSSAGNLPQNSDKYRSLAVLENRLKALEGKNPYKYSAIALDNTLKEDPQILLFFEQYNQEILKNNTRYRDNIDGVDLSGLSEGEKLKAIRLMNKFMCRDSQTIATMSGMDNFCRKLACMIVDSVKKGESEGRINYRIIYEQGKQKNPENILQY